MTAITEMAHPHQDDDNVNHNLYEVARKVDKILHREPIENHAAILGIVQVTSQRRMHENQIRQQQKNDAAHAEAQRQQQFGLQ